ncbi:MAG: peptidoglycan DD-metalloendopeptidase family protein [Boseongicola sp.]|nr:peptidoglycan DD-metalloendopeptidase family protein [Boseongicola sp.]
MTLKNTTFKVIVGGAAVLAISACDRMSNLDFDFRGGAGAFDTSDAAQNAIAGAPQPDARGVVSYPGYQVVVARRGDTVGTIASRVGLPANELARYNAIPENVALREGEIIALPQRIGDAGPTGGNVDVATIAGAAIDRADSAPGLPSGDQPTRHRVSTGETAFSIARSYGVPVSALAEWNGLGADLALREGQYLLIPVRTGDVQVAALDTTSEPGTGTNAPLPPSASEPLPQEETVAAAPAPKPEPQTNTQTAASDNSRLRMPVQGRIIRAYEKGENDGIGIAADAGTSVAAADDGTVAAITRDTDQVPILVLRHEGNLLTVYAGVDSISVKKGDSVKRGQKIAEVRAGSPAFLHFEVREGFDSVDPLPYLQ